ncbi:unnamed protein product [Danaus chrysippus]|uniref:(African queen) hypothetical protein n=1 Tax=Danaus chrysippus TaxID=151541 RepID=A0A8J2W5B1_9NEOP|nr:unnamed protein product [Danaus chrysippus]
MPSALSRLVLEEQKEASVEEESHMAGAGRPSAAADGRRVLLRRPGPAIYGPHAHTRACSYTPTRTQAQRSQARLSAKGNGGAIVNL